MRDLVLVDENPGMLEVARETVPLANVETVLVADLSDPLPAGPFDLVVSALAIHHLDGAAKRALFALVHDRLGAGGVFAMADVVFPEDPADVVTPLTPGYDKPDRADDLLAWLAAVGFRAEQVWSGPDLAVFLVPALVDLARRLHASEEVSLAVVATGVAHVDALSIVFDADRDDGEAQGAGERDGALRDTPAYRVMCGVGDEARREAKLVESALDDVIDLTLAVDCTEHCPDSGFT